MPSQKKKSLWKDPPKTRRQQYGRALGREFRGWMKATGLSQLDPVQSKYRKPR